MNDPAEAYNKPKITPEDAPVGTRILYRSHESLPLREHTVLEWHPEAVAVKLRGIDGCVFWDELLPKHVPRVDIMPPLISSGKAAIIRKACDRPDEEWEKLAQEQQ